MVFFCLSVAGFCSDSSYYNIKKNIAFVTVGGKENRGSVNFEHVFTAGKKWYWSYSVGVQPFNLPDKFSVPLSLNTFTAGSRHHFEADFTATFYMDKYHPYDGGFKDDFNKQLYLSPFACYRFQQNSGLVFKAGVGPQLLLDPPSDNILRFKTKLIGPTFFGSLGISF